MCRSDGPPKRCYRPGSLRGAIKPALVEIAFPADLAGQAEDFLLLPQANEGSQRFLYRGFPRARATGTLGALHEIFVDVYRGSHQGLSVDRNNLSLVGAKFNRSMCRDGEADATASPPFAR